VGIVSFVVGSIEVVLIKLVDVLDVIEGPHLHHLGSDADVDVMTLDVESPCQAQPNLGNGAGEYSTFGLNSVKFTSVAVIDGIEFVFDIASGCRFGVERCDILESASIIVVNLTLNCGPQLSVQVQTDRELL